jgi:hypothetical protein
MSAQILKFPQRGPFSVRVERESDAEGWLVIARDHGWVHGDWYSAFADARHVARGFGVGVVSSAGRAAP